MIERGPLRCSCKCKCTFNWNRWLVVVLAGGWAAGVCHAQELSTPHFLYGSADERYVSPVEGATLLYTVDGSDPKAANGKPSAKAKEAAPSFWRSQSIFGEGTRYRFVVPTSGSEDAHWFKPTFNDSRWREVANGIGYDEEDTYLPLIKTDVKDAMFEKNASLYMRWQFTLEQAPPDGVELDLEIRCDDGFIAYVNGKRVGGLNAPKVANWRSTAEGKVSDPSALKFETIRLPRGGSALRKGSNVLALHGLNDKVSSSDLLFDVKLKMSTFKKGTIVWQPSTEAIEATTSVMIRAHRDGKWSEPLRSPATEPDLDPKAGKGWAKFLGPKGNATYHGRPLMDQWPDQGPAVLWRSPVGQGYASPVVSDGKLILLHRPARDLVVSCFDTATGNELWNKPYKTAYRAGVGTDHGPRGTPTIHDGKVYFSNADGLVGCLRLSDGEEVWSRWLEKDFDTSGSWFGFIASPLVTESGLIVPVGAEDASTVAFGLDDGEIVWKTPGDKISGASPMKVEIAGVPQILSVGREYVRGLRIDNGEELWSHPTRGQSSGNTYCAGPIVYRDELLLSGWYGLGALRLGMSSGKPQQIWHRDDFISTHYASLILYEGYAYGYHGHAFEQSGPVLRCVKISTGEVQWERPKDGSGTVIRSRDQLLILKDNGELTLIKANPKRYDEVGRAQVTRRITRSYPAIIDGLAYIKGPRNLVCVDLRK